ncbi:MAG: hypothetical protein E6230_25270 [Paenibacillus dendritiformis]|uniref:hypothetical protein n=1 Tax=Paenibacillus dendritiformis TaxID=130049 RepID=UPI00143DD863|nr:hypothetical protein [Paenibacillus dendritiformis]MDU5145488.1 hypothetical protein [Paenibacillus dendritiformis]NKI20440.1 hypothetical protein [Paenibacillus dendritiformis]NRG01538.1 hypothetical protein [Paenibacillus dendritiformis]
MSVEWGDHTYWTDIKREGSFELANGLMSAEERAKLLSCTKEVEPEDLIWKLDIGQAKAIAAGNLRSYAVLKDGTVWSWKNIVQKKKYAAAQLPGFPKMAAIAAGRRNGDWDKPTYASVTAGSNGAILLTKNKEMLFFGYLSVPFRTGNLYQKADCVAASGSNVSVNSNGQMCGHTERIMIMDSWGTARNTKYETAQPIRFSE